MCMYMLKRRSKNASLPLISITIMTTITSTIIQVPSRTKRGKSESIIIIIYSNSSMEQSKQSIVSMAHCQICQYLCMDNVRRPNERKRERKKNQQQQNPISGLKTKKKRRLSSTIRLFIESTKSMLP